MNQAKTNSQQSQFSPQQPPFFPSPTHFGFSSNQGNRSFHFSDLKQSGSTNSYSFYSPQKQYNRQYQEHSYYPYDRDQIRMSQLPLSAVQSQNQAFQQMFQFLRQSMEEQSQRNTQQTQEYNISQHSSRVEDSYVQDNDPTVGECQHQQQRFFIGQMKAIEDFYQQMNIQTDLDPSIEDLKLYNYFSSVMPDKETKQSQNQDSSFHDGSSFCYSPKNQRYKTQQDEENITTPTKNYQSKNQQQKYPSFKKLPSQFQTQISPEQQEKQLDNKQNLLKDQEIFTKSQEKGSSSNKKINNLIVDSPDQLMNKTNTTINQKEAQKSTKYQQVIRTCREYDEKPISSMGATKNFEELLEEKIKESENEYESKSAFKDSQSVDRIGEKQENNQNGSDLKDFEVDQRCLIEKLLQEIEVHQEQILNKIIKEEINDSGDNNQNNSKFESFELENKAQLNELIRRIQECWQEIVSFKATLSSQSQLLQTQKAEIFSMKEKLKRQRNNNDNHLDTGNILNNSNSNNKQNKEQLLVTGSITAKQHFNSQQLIKQLREQNSGLKEQLHKQTADSQLKIKQLEKSLHSALYQSGQLRKEVILLQKQVQLNKLDEVVKTEKQTQKSSKQLKSLMSQSFQIPATLTKIIPEKIIKKPKGQEQNYHSRQYQTERTITSKSQINQSQLEKEHNSEYHSVNLQSKGFKSQNKVKVSTNLGQSSPSLKEPQVSLKGQTQQEKQ